MRSVARIRLFGLPASDRSPEPQRAKGFDFSDSLLRGQPLAKLRAPRGQPIPRSVEVGVPLDLLSREPGH